MSNQFQLGVLIAVAILICLLRMFMFAVGAVVYVYLLPGVIAMKRRYVHADRIMIACVLGGWTGLVWLAALGFALALPDASGEPLSTSTR